MDESVDPWAGETLEPNLFAGGQRVPLASGIKSVKRILNVCNYSKGFAPPNNSGTHIFTFLSWPDLCGRLILFFFSFPLLLHLGNNHSWHYWHLGISGALASPLAAIPANVLNPLAFEALVCAFHIPNFCSVCRFMTNVFVYPNIILLWLMCFLHPSSPPCPAPFSTGSQQFFPFFCVHRLAVVDILCAVRVYI